VTTWIRWSLVVLLSAHGLIHLLGAAKGLGWASLPQWEKGAGANESSAPAGGGTAEVRREPWSPRSATTACLGTAGRDLGRRPLGRGGSRR